MKARFRVIDPVSGQKVTATRRGKSWVQSCDWVGSCSGCCEVGEYGSGSDRYSWHAKHQCLIGMGCGECGHRGIRRNSMWVPLTKDVHPELNAKLRKKLAA